MMITRSLSYPVHLLRLFFLCGASLQKNITITLHEGVPPLGFQPASPNDLLAVALDYALRENLHLCRNHSRGDAGCSRVAQDLLILMLTEQHRVAAVEEMALTREKPFVSLRDICPNKKFEHNLAAHVPEALTVPAQSLSESASEFLLTHLGKIGGAVLEVGGPTMWMGDMLYNSMRQCDNVVLDGADPNSTACLRGGNIACGNSVDPLLHTELLQYSVNVNGGWRLINFTADEDLSTIAEGFAHAFGLPQDHVDGRITRELTALRDRHAASMSALRRSAAMAAVGREEGGGRSGPVAVASEPYRVKDRVLGRTFTVDGARTGLPDGQYSTLMASHALEHFPDPFAALLEWRRLLQPGGRLVCVLPWPTGTFDRTRKVSSAADIIANHVVPSKQRLLISGYDATFTGWAPKAAYNDEDEDTTEGSKAAFRVTGGGAIHLPSQGKPNGWEHDIHWHVFSFSTLFELFRCLGFSVEFMELVEPFHMFVIGQKLEM